MLSLTRLLLTCVWMLIAVLPLTAAHELNADLAAAQSGRDAAAVKTAAAQLVAALGDRAGVPSEAAEFILPDQDAKGLEAEQVPGLFVRAFETIQQQAWWKTHPAATEAAAPLRVVASVVAGCLAARTAGCSKPEALLEAGREAGDYLLVAQQAGGQGCFPFPAWKGKRGRYGQIADRLLGSARTGGNEAEAIHEGWIVDDQNSGELNLDHAQSGSAILALYEATKNERYLASAQAAAKWSLARPAVPLAHQNAYTIQFLVRMFEITKEAKFLDAALELCRLGILPTQLSAGPQKGRWADPQDARAAYHFQILDALTVLLIALPAEHPDRSQLTSALQLGLLAYEQEILTQGGTSLDATLETFCLLIQHQDKLGPLLAATHTSDVARMIFRASVEEYRLEHPTLSPGTWGRFLQYTAGK